MDIETEHMEHKRVENLIAMSLYRARVHRIKEHVREFYKRYEPYLKSIEEVRNIMGKEVSEEKAISQEVVDIRRMETH
jgi:phage baseplate assembly protein W